MLQDLVYAPMHSLELPGGHCAVTHWDHAALAMCQPLALACAENPAYGPLAAKAH